jgi:hypothetical protein
MTQDERTHTLAQQVNYLRAALEQDKKPIGMLIGAGAPMALRLAGEPLIPGLEELTAKVLTDVPSKYRRSLATLVTHLAEPDQGNLEAILNYVRSIAALPGDSEVRGVEMSTLKQLDAEICLVLRGHVDATLPEGDNPYAALSAWIQSVRRTLPTQLFTTNYDLLIEQALERQRVAYFDGFMGTREPIFDLQAIEQDDLPPRWTLLWKLHGSINWAQDVDGNVIRRAPDPAEEDSALVYPSHLKYDQSRRLPYLAMLDRLKAFLRKPGAILISSGFSFRDQHINEVIDQSLRANPTASVHALLFENLDQYAEAVRIAGLVPNLTLAARDGGVLGCIRGGWVEPDPSTGGYRATTCDLGDFTKLGEFLRSLTGDGAGGNVYA